MKAPKTHRLWKHIELTDNWLRCDTSTIDDLSPSWYERRAILQHNSKEYQEFIAQLKREHAIETGIVERMYDLERGITIFAKLQSNIPTINASSAIKTGNPSEIR